MGGGCPTPSDAKEGFLVLRAHMLCWGSHWVHFGKAGRVPFPVLSLAHTVTFFFLWGEGFGPYLAILGAYCCLWWGESDHVRCQGLMNYLLH